MVQGQQDGRFTVPTVVSSCTFTVELHKSLESDSEVHVDHCNSLFAPPPVVSFLFTCKLG